MTIVGYSKKQQASFDELPLNKVDILIVACLSYFGFKEVADLMPFKIGDLKDNAYFQSKDAYYAPSSTDFVEAMGIWDQKSAD